MKLHRRFGKHRFLELPSIGMVDQNGLSSIGTLIRLLAKCTDQLICDRYVYQMLELDDVMEDEV